MMSQRISASDAPSVTSIPFLGTSWYSRGAGYWVKRVLMTLLFALLLFFGVSFVVAFSQGFSREMSGQARAIFYSVVVVVVIGSHIIGFRDVRRRRFRSVNSNAAGGSKGMGLGAAALGGSTIAGAFMAVGMFIGIGWFTALFCYSMTKYGSAFDAQEVRRMSAWFEDHPEIPNEQRPKQFRQ